MTEPDKQKDIEMDPSSTETKSQPTARIAKLKVGQNDDSGNVISDILALGNEYAIYEIEAGDINRKLKVYIDGVNDKREKELIDRFVQVKDLYIKAKGLLYRTENFGLMKNRVAHSLATALTGHVDLAKGQFDELLKDINDEYKAAYRRRLIYMLPSFSLLALLTVVIYAIACLGLPAYLCNDACEWLKITYAAVIGGTFALTFNMKSNRFDSEISEWVYALFGLERTIIAILAGVIGAIGIKSKFIFANIASSPTEIWSLLFLVIIAAFSEKLIPSVIGKYENQKTD